MKKNYLVKGLLLTFLGFAAVPAFALTLDKPPMIKSDKAAIQKKLKSKYQLQAQSNGEVNPLYPVKYTATYIQGIKDEYNAVTKDEIVCVSLDMLKGTNGDFSRKAILGNNLIQRPMKVEFKDLSTINKSYGDYDALGWKRGKNLYIYINQKHSTSPAIALAALLSHEAIHQDEYNSLSEETYAWTMEAAVFTELVGLYPDYELNLDSLVQREKTLKKLFERGNYTNKYIKKTVYSNEGYQNLPISSPGFEEL